MADYLTTDTELTSVANAIRTKGGTSGSLVYPTGFVSAIQAIPTGGTYQAKTGVNPSTSSQTITPDTGYDALSSVQINAMPSGSAATPATTITANPSISVSSSGLITATASATQSVTPTVSAGYVSSGTAGTITVSGSNTSQLTTQEAQTIHPSTTDKTITSGKYLTGAQTVKGVLLTNLTAGNIKKDVVVKIGDSMDDDCVTSVTGTYAGGITPTGTISITQNGTYDVTNYASANVNVSGGGGGITLKRIAGTGTNTINVSGWGGNDFITASSLNENPPKVVFANFTYAGVILPACAKIKDIPDNEIILVGDRQSSLFRAVFTTSGSVLNYNSVKLSHFYIGNSDYKNNVGTWEIYSNVQSVAQFSFVIEFDSMPVDTYQADEGLTWMYWVESDYNADQLYQFDGENIIYDDGANQLYVCDSNLDPVTIDMEIIENETYQLVMM